MKVQHGHGKTQYGPGVEVNLSGDEVAIAIDAYLVSHNIIVRGARTVRVNGKLCKSGHIYVDPEGSVIIGGVRFNGDGTTQ